MVFIKENPKRFCWGWHELASSVRTSWMPLYAVTNDRIIFVGYPTKQAGCVQLPEDTIAVVHYYVTTRGNRRITIYTKENVIELNELWNFEVPEHSDPLIKSIARRVIEELIYSS